MSINPAFNTDPVSHVVDVPGPLSERLLTERDGLPKWIADAVAPFRVQMSPIPGGIQLEGDGVAVDLTARMLEQFGAALSGAGTVDGEAARTVIRSVIKNELRHDLAFRLQGLAHPVRPMSLSQVAFMRELLDTRNTMIIGTGPTGTGKTHLAIAAGLNQLALERSAHMVVTRPHVLLEGEIATPASRQETEYDEQFNVFEDTLRELVGYKAFRRLVDQQKLEIVPLGRMRGRTFNDTFIVIDEAQDMTQRKMRMAVTRLGQGSRMVILGEPEQSHLPGEQVSGLSQLLGMVEGSDIATIFRFEKQQIVRNRIVARLEELYSSQGDPEAAFYAA